MKDLKVPPPTGAHGDDGDGDGGCLAPSSARRPGPVDEPVPDNTRDLIGRAKWMLRGVLRSVENEDYMDVVKQLVLILDLIDRMVVVIQMREEAYRNGK